MSQAEVYQKLVCRLCDRRRLERVVTLTPTPPGNHFVTLEQLDQPQTCYPLELDFCLDCHHVQLRHVVHPEILYQRNYSYVSGTSPVFVAHLRDCAASVIQRFAPARGGLVVDIGSNDGTALRCYQEAGYRVLGFDPATEIAQRATAAGIETVCDFFSLRVAEQHLARDSQAALVISHNACAHIDDLRGVLQGVRLLLADDGVFVMEVGYLLDIVQNTWFDTIYHEHVDFHSVAPLVPFFASVGLEIIAVERVSPQGGSIRVIAQPVGGSRQPDGTVAKLVSLEREAGLDRPGTFKAFGETVNRIGAQLGAIVRELRAAGKTIAGYGAPTKATTMLSHFQLGDVLDFLVEDNPLKQNLFSPGLHIPVVPATELYQRKPDYLLILAWNFGESIMQRHRAFATQGGRFILPMPTPHIVS